MENIDDDVCYPRNSLTSGRNYSSASTLVYDRVKKGVMTMEIKHKGNTIFLIFKDEDEAEMYYAMHGELWEKIGVRLQPCCAGGYMNAYSLEKLGKPASFDNEYL